MSYIFKQKLQITDLVHTALAVKKVLIHESEEYLAALYAYYLQSHNFDVKHCPDIRALKAFAENFQPDVLVFSSGEDKVFLQNIAWLTNFKKNFPNTLVVSIGFKTGAEELKKLMSVGVSSHINRHHSRPQDLAVVVKTLLNN